ncbi:MAG: ATP synthase F1 subunit gamma [Clostridiales bacterium]|nr:ATP synthase F1 subunit gamma [Clostridiales bacterium]MDY3747938.1 ATP synthase F1 subunit gamma [Lachnospiraceae bacterium]
MASMREIKRRKGSIQSTAKITKAMKLVSTVKFQKSKGRAENSKPYFDKMYETVSSILAKSGNILHPYLTSGGDGKKAVIVITSNRGLAGGYNSNIVKLVLDSGLSKEDTVLYAVGRKGKDTLSRRGYEVAGDYSEVMEAPMYTDAMDIGKDVLKAYKNNEISELYLAYTSFKNTVTHIPKLIKLLPVNQAAADEVLKDGSDDQRPPAPMNYEPEPEEVLDALIPKYVCSLIYGALMEAAASENGARMTAMDNATSNAEEMIDQLTLSYNRARQGAITQEITEIVSGSEALA